MFEKEPQSFETGDKEKKDTETSREVFNRALEENGKLPGEVWIAGIKEIGGRLDQQYQEFFEKEEMSASEFVRFFAAKGKFREPEEKRITELKEVGKEEKAGIEIIQNLPLSVRDRVELLMCFFGEKQATTFIHRQIQVHPEVSEKFTELLRKREEIIKKYLNKLNLVYEIKDNWEEVSSGGEPKSYCLFHISKNRENLRKLVESWDREINESSTPNKRAEAGKQIGLLYGYPQTAVEAWVKRVREVGRRPPLGESWDNPYALKREEISHLPEIPEEKREEIENITKFANFNFSREHWQEELNELSKITGKIRDKAPELYEEFLLASKL